MDTASGAVSACVHIKDCQGKQVTWVVSVWIHGYNSWEESLNMYGKMFSPPLHFFLKSKNK